MATDLPPPSPPLGGMRAAAPDGTASATATASTTASATASASLESEPVFPPLRQRLGRLGTRVAVTTARLAVIVCAVAATLAALHAFQRRMRRGTECDFVHATPFMSDESRADVRERCAEFRRHDTVLDAIVGFVEMLVVVAAILMSLYALGIRSRSLLATAGVSGVILGFGAQTVVRDLLNGVFMVAENQFVVGDYVKILSGDNPTPLAGIVTDMSMRTTQVRQFEGGMQYVPNGSIAAVVNYSRLPQRVDVDFRAAHGADMGRVVAVARAAAAALEAERTRDDPSMKDVMTPVQALSVFDADDAGFSVVLRMFTVPGAQWGVTRHVRSALMDAMNRAGIPSAAARIEGVSPGPVAGTAPTTRPPAAAAGVTGAPAARPNSTRFQRAVAAAGWHAAAPSSR